MTHHRLKAARLERHWSQKRLAHELGTTEKTISRWERGEQRPSLYFREQLKTLLGLSWREPERNADQKHTTSQPSFKVLRLERGWSQQRVAHELGVSRKTITRWEQGANVPSLPHREQLRTSLGWVRHEPGESAERARDALQRAETPFAASAAPLWNVPARRNPFFTGREELLSHVHTHLSQERTVVLTQSLSLSGLGGIGKTQTALEYAYRHAQDYSAVLWMAAESPETMLASFSALVKVLALPEKDEQDQDKMVTAVVRWLSTHPNWLLIVDNVEDLALVKRFLPTTHRGSLLFTTRLQSLGALAYPLSVERMPVEEGIWLLLQRARRVTKVGNLDQACSVDLTPARAIVEALDGLPLAIDQAGAYLEETQCSMEEYFQLYQRTPLALLDEREAHVDHPASVVRTFALAFEKIERRSPAAAELLRGCAFLAPDTIPERLLIEGASHLGPLVQTLVEDPVRYNAALKALLSYSLIQRHAESRTLSIHRLVQVVLKESMAEEKRKHWALRILLAVEQVFPLAGPGTSVLLTMEQREWSAQLFPHARLCVTWSEWQEERFQQVASLLLKMGFTQLDRVQYEEAEYLLQRALLLFEQQVGPEHPLVATSLNGLGALYYLQGKYREAEPLYQRALRIREQQLGPQHPLVATSLSGLAALCQAQGKYGKAERLYQRALHIREQTLEPCHPDTAEVLNSLGKLYLQQGRYPEAEPLLQRALVIVEQSVGLSHPLTRMILANLARLKEKQEPGSSPK